MTTIPCSLGSVVAPLFCMQMQCVLRFTDALTLVGSNKMSSLVTDPTGEFETAASSNPLHQPQGPEEAPEKDGNFESEEQQLHKLLLPDMRDLPHIPPSAVESNFVSYFAPGKSLLNYYHSPEFTTR